METLWRSTIGLKVVVAASGVLLLAWVALHVAGNLAVFSGPAAADGYAATLRRAPAWLWLARVGLAVAAAVHVAGVVALARTGRRARGRRAVRGVRGPAALASRTMRIGGVLLLAFVGFHVLHLTLGVLHPGFRPGHVYDNVVLGLRSPGIALVYVGAAALVALHLFHGLWAAAGSLGLRADAPAKRRRPAAAVVAAAIGLGFASVPLAVLAGWLR